MPKTVAYTKLVLLLLSGVIIIPTQLFFTYVIPPVSRRLPIYYHSFLLRLIGLKVTVHGELPDNEPAICVANHAGYIDIPVMGSLMEGCFVAKAEVANWPFFGPLSKAGRTLFVDRTRRSQARKHVDMIKERLNNNESVFFFPEGSSNDGNRVDPFKSTLLAAAEIELEDGSEPWVRPMSVAYTGLYGMPAGRRLRALFAWYGDMTMAPHLFQLFQIGAAEVQVWFHKPVKLSEFDSRKELTQYCYDVISRRHAKLLAGNMAEAA